MKWITIKIPGKPATKGSTRSFRSATTGKIVTLSANKRLRPWEKMVYWEAKKEWGPTPSRGPIAVSIATQIRRHKSDRPIPPLDVDKIARAVCDGLAGAVYVNDSQVVYLMSSKSWGSDSHCEITASESFA